MDLLHCRDECLTSIGFAVHVLGCLYSGRTLVERSRDILGKWLGTCLSLLFFYVFLYSDGSCLTKSQRFSNLIDDAMDQLFIKSRLEHV
ncbi:GerAB/ArcD/ProY family transporter [Paenibacillus phytorum]|uniref:GerAB/ArcD/ProY family transporter n=1 Tax=Paenibacillus phytorum TaxID=2654977 RepID=UPI0035E43372